MMMMMRGCMVMMVSYSCIILPDITLEMMMMMAIVSCIIPVYTVENPLTVSVSSSPVCDNTAHKEAER